MNVVGRLLHIHMILFYLTIYFNLSTFYCSIDLCHCQFNHQLFRRMDGNDSSVLLPRHRFVLISSFLGRWLRGRPILIAVSNSNNCFSTLMSSFSQFSSLVLSPPTPSTQPLLLLPLTEEETSILNANRNVCNDPTAKRDCTTLSHHVS